MKGKSVDAALARKGATTRSAAITAPCDGLKLHYIRCTKKPAEAGWTLLQLAGSMARVMASAHMRRHKTRLFLIPPGLPST